MVKEDRCIELAKHCVGLDRKNPYTRHGKNGTNHTEITMMQVAEI